MKAEKGKSANVITFTSLANVMPQGLPRSILSYEYSEMLKDKYGIPMPFTIYDRWAVAMNGLDIAKAFFDGTAINCTLLQDMPKVKRPSLMEWPQCAGIRLNKTTLSAK